MPPTKSVATTLKVLGSITLTVPLATFGTYTRVGSFATTGLNTPEASAAYTLTGPVGEGEEEGVCEGLEMDGEGDGGLWDRAATAGVDGWAGSSLSFARTTETMAVKTTSAPTPRVSARPIRLGRRCSPLPIWGMLPGWTSPRRTATGSPSKPHPPGGVGEPQVARGCR